MPTADTHHIAVERCTSASVGLWEDEMFARFDPKGYGEAFFVSFWLQLALRFQHGFRTGYSDRATHSVRLNILDPKFLSR